MKGILKILILSLVLVMLNQCSATDNDEIIPVAIPDNNFRSALVEGGFDLNGDGFIDSDEAALVLSLDVSYDNIADMTGIEAFVHLDTLNCAGNQLTSLDVSQNAMLELLNCSDNQLDSLAVSNYPTLRWLYCNNNRLPSLVLTHSSALIGLYLNNMPSLHKVCIWTEPFPPAGVQIDTTNSPNLYFTMYCD